MFSKPLYLFTLLQTQYFAAAKQGGDPGHFRFFSQMRHFNIYSLWFAITQDSSTELILTDF